MNRWLGMTAGVIIAAALILLLVVGPKTGNVENLRNILLSYGPWAIAISAGLMVAQAIIAPLPANVIVITNGLVFGPFWGCILSWATTVLGASLCFLLSKTLGKRFAFKIVGNSLNTAEAFFKQYGLHAVFVVRIMPFVPFDAVSYGAGLVGVSYFRFLIATAVGIIPSMIVYSYIGKMIAGVYWWVLVGILSVSLLAVISASFLLRKPKSQVIITKIAA